MEKVGFGAVQRVLRCRMAGAVLLVGQEVPSASSGIEATDGRVQDAG